MKLFLSGFLIAGVLFGAEPVAQTEARKRPKLGVALAGGAALGLAHVGVLQWLEEHRIPIDYIAGTSMGGLVSGMQATGMTSAEMLDFVGKVDWNLALSSSSPYRALAFRRKEDQAAFPVSLELGLKGGKLGLPSGLSAGQGVGLVIDRMTAQYGNMKSFDDLPTPFRCVASNLATGKGVVFEKGSLFDALRATMSLPALFSPLRLDGMTLVDGALTDNLPVDVVKGMGADYTIAVALDVPIDPKDFETLLGVAGSSISYMIAANERPQIAAADLVVMPLLKGMTSSDYMKWEEFRKIGYAAAEKKAAMLEKFQVSEAEFQAYTAARRAKRLPGEIRPQEIRISGDVAPKMKASLEKAIMPPAGENVDVKKLEEQMLKVTGTGRFETASYQYVKEQGKDVLVVHATERPNAPPFIKPLILIDGASGEGIQFGIGARLTFLDLGGAASEWRTDGVIGTQNQLSSEYYYRIRGGKWFFAPRGSYTKRSVPLYDASGRNVASYDKTDYNGAVDLGYSFGRFEEFRVGHQIGHLDFSVDTGAPTLQEGSGQYGVTRALFRRDTRNGPLVPTKGTFLMLQASWFEKFPNVPRGFAAYEGYVQHAHSFNPLYSVAVSFSAGSTVEEAPLRVMYDLGGFGRMSALPRSQMLGNNYYNGNLFVRRALSSETISLFAKLYGTVGYEVGRAWYSGGTATPRHDGVVGLLGATRIGVMFFGVAIGDQGDRKLLFRFGRNF